MFFDVLGIDIVYVDCSSLTGAGWKGKSIDDELGRIALIQEEAPGAIVAILWDEAGKMRTSGSAAHSFNPQQELLGFFDGGSYCFYDESKRKMREINTRLVLNVFSGAFTGIESIVEERLIMDQTTFGFTAETQKGQVGTEDLRAEITVADLIDGA
jgi:ATP-dependent protease Clp ATPase subunit